MTDFADREAALDRINDDPAWAQRAYGAPGLTETVILAALRDPPPPITRDEARARLLGDPMLAARVELAVREMERDHGVRLDRGDLALAQEAATWALLVAERFP